MKYTDKPINRIVVKVGTSSLVNEQGSLDSSKIRALVRQLADAKQQGKDVILVTSGAIRAGMERLAMSERPKTIPDQQATAAVGQGALMQKYTELLSAYDMVSAQVLVTWDDFEDRERYLNARNTFHTLIDFGCLPIVNNNDTVATDEIRFGDNDTLSARVAACVDADLLVNLSDVEGLCDGDPKTDPNCKVIPEVAKITPDIEALAGGTRGLSGTGGMRTKLEAAKIATKCGVRMVIANAQRPNAIIDAIGGKQIGTTFLAVEVGLNHRKRWIAFANRVKGSLVINDGAKRSLVKDGKSLLAVGITDCTGDRFKVGDQVMVVDESGVFVGRGLVNYSAADLALIKGKRSDEIEQILGYKDFDEVIHRDNLVLGV